MPIDHCYSGEHIAEIPSSPGVYAWYYLPSVYDPQANSTVFSQVAKHSEVDYELAIRLRYGLTAAAKGKTDVAYGRERASLGSILRANVEAAGPFLESLVCSRNFLLFSRPLYIGIAKNLYKRVYEQHYRKISEYWDPKSGVSTFLKNNPECTVQQVIDSTLEEHSFALEARVRGVPARDLVVVTHEIVELKDLGLDIGEDEESESADSSKRRSIEQLLHIVTDPVCGRR